MKKFYLIFALLTYFGICKAQNPEAIYMATWTLMSDLGKPITPNENDPKLTYNPDTQCYEGEVIDWQRMGVNPYNVKIPYSVEGEIITYYGVAGPTQSFIFNEVDSQTFEFTANTNPASFKGFGLSMQNTESLVDVEVSLSLETHTITFTKFESGEVKDTPVLVSVDPENGGEIVPDETGGAEITLVFSGEVTSMEAICDGSTLGVASNPDGTVWTVAVPSSRLQDLSGDSQGKLSVKIQKVYSGNIPVSFENGNPVLDLSYSIAGVTKYATLEFQGSPEALNTLNVYKSPEYSVGDEVEFEGDSYSFTYTKSVTYLFTAGSEYEISISSTVESNDGENWKLGEGYSTLKGPNGETTNRKAVDGVTLTIYKGSDGAVFTINVYPKEAGIDSIAGETGSLKVYSIGGTFIMDTDNAENLHSLKEGIYIINGKKVMIK